MCKEFGKRLELFNGIKGEIGEKITEELIEKFELVSLESQGRAKTAVNNMLFTIMHILIAEDEWEEKQKEENDDGEADKTDAGIGGS